MCGSRDAPGGNCACLPQPPPPVVTTLPAACPPDELFAPTHRPGTLPTSPLSAASSPTSTSSSAGWAWQSGRLGSSAPRAPSSPSPPGPSGLAPPTSRAATAQCCCSPFAPRWRRGWPQGWWGATALLPSSRRCPSQSFLRHLSPSLSIRVRRQAAAGSGQQASARPVCQ